MTSEFVGDHNPNGETGVTKVEYTFYDMNNTDDKVSFIVNYDATETNDIKDMLMDYSISNAYPNPANTYVSINYDFKGNRNAKIAIYNLLGTAVKEIELTESFGTLKVNTSDLIEGIYFYSLLINNESISTHKLIIKH
ncbi:MAG: T9SS type A sorting domain-containing protein [Bacteroidales bacterium]